MEAYESIRPMLDTGDIVLFSGKRRSSARAHLGGGDGGLVQVGPPLGLVSDWSVSLEEGPAEADREDFRTHKRTHRPLGSEPLSRGWTSCWAGF